MSTIYKLTLIMLVLWSAPIFAQNQANSLKPIAREIKNLTEAKTVFIEQNKLFALNKSASHRIATASSVEGASLLELQPSQLKTMTTQSASHINLTIPSIKGDFNLQLFEVNPFSEGFTVTTSDGGHYKNLQGKHYRGIINGDNNSLAAISIYDNEIMGMIMNKDGNHVLGKLGNGTATEYVVYNDKYLPNATPSQCEVLKTPEGVKVSKRSLSAARTESSKCVKIYWEADYPIYTDKGSSVQNVVNYLTGLFNQSKIIYDNDGISVSLSELFVWTSASPYGTGSSSERLVNFRNYRTSYNGNLAHLLSYGGGGGVAYLNTLCVQPWAYGYSGIYSTYSNLPAYSWSVMVVTHEQGHTLGSQHTHDCVWNGNNTAIDACASTSCTSLEGSAPAGGGTIMSYCHLTSTGINLAKGFGPQPKQRITETINNASCTSSDCSTSSPPPVAVISNGIYNIQSLSSSLFIDVVNASVADHAQVIQNTMDSLTHQRWQAVNLGEGFWKFININSTLALQVPDSANEKVVNLQQGIWTGHLYQQWRLLDAGNGAYFFINRGSSLAMDVYGNGKNPGERIIQWLPGSQNNQKWKLNLLTAPADSTDAALSESVPENLNSEKILVYPNPAQSEIKVVFYEAEEKQVRLEIYSATGLKIHTASQAARVGRNELTVTLSENTGSGIYILRIDKKRTKLIVRK